MASSLQPWRLHCARCGDRIGVYERLWWQRADGTLTATSHRAVKDGRVQEEPGSRALHLACAGTAAGSPPAE